MKLCSKSSAIIASLLVLGGCASITGSKNQPVKIDAVHNGKVVYGADCTLTNDRGSWYTKTPRPVVVQKSGEDLLVTCNADEVPAGSAKFASSANGGMWGNILLGGLIGYAVDSNTGAGYDYPSNITVQLGQIIKLDPPKPVGSVSDSGSQNLDGNSANSSGLVFADGSNKSSTGQKLRELKLLKDEGVITTKEYNSKKAELLKTM